MARFSSAAVVAFSCRPNSGSEWGVGWNYLLMVAENFTHVTLFVRDAEQQIETIQEALHRLEISNVVLVPIPDLGLYRLFRKPAIHARFLTAYYFIWLWSVFFFMATRRVWRNHDWLFHVTWVSDWIFSPVFLLPFRRKIVGPLGSQPANFNRASHDYTASRRRVAVKALLRLFSPNLATALLADASVGISGYPLSRFPWKLCLVRRVISPVHCELAWHGPRSADRAVLFVGKHLPFKNLDLFLRVAARLLQIDPGIAIHVLGDRQLRARAPNYIAEAGLDGLVCVHGLVPMTEVAQHLAGQQAILLQTSSEAGGTIGVEAITLGAPVVCVRGYGLDAFLADQNYPYAVRYSAPEQFTDDAVRMIRQIFFDYDRHSSYVQALSERFSFRSSHALFADMLRAAFAGSGR